MDSTPGRASSSRMISAPSAGPTASGASDIAAGTLSTTTSAAGGDGIAEPEAAGPASVATACLLCFLRLHGCVDAGHRLGHVWLGGQPEATHDRQHGALEVLPARR